MQKVWEALTKFYSLDVLRVVIQPYPWFNLTVIQFQVLSKRSEDFNSLLHQRTSFEAGTLLQRPDSVDTTVKSSTAKSRRSDWIFVLLDVGDSEAMSSPINRVIASAPNGRNWTGFSFQRGRLLPVLAMPVEFFIKALGIFWLRPPEVQGTEAEEEGNIVMRPESRSSLTSSFIDWWLLFSAA